MKYTLANIFWDRQYAFSHLWYEIIKTRVILCVTTVVFTYLTRDTVPFKYILGVIFTYFVLNLLLGFWDSSELHQKRVRAIPAVLDVGFISSLIYFTGGQNSMWFLLYLFPIISVSRYLSYEGTVPLMFLTVVTYTLTLLMLSQSLDLYALILKCLVLLGVSLAAGNLTRARQLKEESLLETFKEIDNAILDNTETNEVLKLILKKAMVFTNSQTGQLKVLNDENKFVNTIAVKDDAQTTDWKVESLTDRYYMKVLDSKKPLYIHWLRAKKESGGQEVQDAQYIEERSISLAPIVYVEESSNIPGSALFFPLILDEKLKAIMALFSKNGFHYLPSEMMKLGSFAHLIGIALKNDSYTEKTKRLKMLYELGEQLKVEQGLLDLFRRVVELTYNRLNSEEAALFIWDEANKNIKKEEVEGPSRKISEKLKYIEKPYQMGESLVGRIFQDKELKHLSLVGGVFQDKTVRKESFLTSDVEYYDDYSKTLPSKKVTHYLGVPLVIGEEVLGVIRVINKRAANYSIEQQTFSLSEKGFEEEDVELMHTIASQVAAAIRSAKFIEVQRYYREVVENSPDPIIVLDNRGKIIVFNKICETIWGFKSDEVIGTHVTAYYENEEHAREIGELLECSPNHRIQDHLTNIKSLGGEIIPISLSAALLFDKQNRKVGSIGVFKDLRETLKLQAEKTNAERLATLGKLAHTIGHEIKHDIATALNYIDTLAYEASDDEELTNIYREIQESLGEAVDKFQNMLLVGRPKPPMKEIIDAEYVFTQVKESMSRRAAYKEIDFMVDYQVGDSELSADVMQLRQALLNLFDNSLDAIETKKYGQATGEKGRIELLGQTRNGHLHITWKDNGCGISPQNTPNIFTPFITDKANGNGLGLFIVKSIINNHGGDVTVESEEGKGAVFKIVLPLAQETIQDDDVIH